MTLNVYLRHTFLDQSLIIPICFTSHSFQYRSSVILYPAGQVSILVLYTTL